MTFVSTGLSRRSCVRRRIAKFTIPVLATLWAGLIVTPAFGEDGSDLWLRYDAAPGADIQTPSAITVACDDPSETLRIAVQETQTAFRELIGEDLEQRSTLQDNALILVSPNCHGGFIGENVDFSALGKDGYRIHTQGIDDAAVTVISGQSDVAVLYGVFDYLLRTSRGETVGDIDLMNAPSVDLRLLNHWDNLDRHVERGYAGQSIWDWHRLPGFTDQLYIDYARANASVGINGTVLTNVNADSTVLTAPYIDKVAALADVFRPYGIRVYLTARFSSPIELGGLATADPLDPAVQDWWQDKVAEIYKAVPDFGGFLVKANSEGQPGPQDYNRSHAEGANMLADALGKHGGTVMWRAFVYSADESEDRVKQAFTEFTPLDGKFADNVLVQVKNGPLDFQPREPFHSMFGQMPNTPLMIEFQITKEYLGFSTHLAYLGTLWEDVLQSDTYVAGEGSSVARVVNGSLHNNRVTGMAGVANIGSDRNWSGSIFDQANWFAFGRMAWQPNASARDIAEEWAALTFSGDATTTDTVVEIMMSSREAVVDYMTPLGLTHLMGTGHHYGPAPWVDDLGRDDWNPYYYHRATKDLIGIDRTQSGTDAISQYADPLQQRWADIQTTPEDLLLWFHRVPWDYRMKSGQTLWEELVEHYDRGVAHVDGLRSSWRSLEAQVDPTRYKQISQFLDIQFQEATWWRDASLAYWMSVNELDLPSSASPPALSLEAYKAMAFPYAPGQGE